MRAPRYIATCAAAATVLVGGATATVAFSGTDQGVVDSASPNATSHSVEDIVIDLREDPSGLEWLESATEQELDGRQVFILGLETVSSHERQAKDLELVREQGSGGPSAAVDECLQTLPVVNPGQVRSYIGCDPIRGHELVDVNDTGTLEGDVASAMAYVVTDYVVSMTEAMTPEPTDITPSVIVTQNGELIVDFPDRLLNLKDLAYGGSGPELWRRLAVTSMTSESVTGVEFRVQSDCLRFALATGGDDCPGVVSRSELEGEIFE